MSPLNFIHDGILEGDWEKVCKGYEQLTGEKLVAKATEDEKSSDPIYADTVQDHVKKTSSRRTSAKNAATTAIRKKPQARKKTKSQQELDDTEIEYRQTQVPKRSKKAKKSNDFVAGYVRNNNRETSPDKVKAECVKCHREFEIHPKYLLTVIEEHGEVKNKFKCNGCMVSRAK